MKTVSKTAHSRKTNVLTCKKKTLEEEGAGNLFHRVIVEVWYAVCLPHRWAISSWNITSRYPMMRNMPLAIGAVTGV